MVWPRIVIIFLFVYSLLANIVKHGRQTEFNAYDAFFRVLLWGWLLYEGGFWNIFI